jgi:hypothetical protein
VKTIVLVASAVHVPVAAVGHDEDLLMLLMPPFASSSSPHCCWNQVSVDVSRTDDDAAVDDDDDDTDDTGGAMMIMMMMLNAPKWSKRPVAAPTILQFRRHPVVASHVDASGFPFE